MSQRHPVLGQARYVDVTCAGTLAQALSCLQVLMQQVWPLLAITASVHRALYAWILFRQAVLSGDGSLLEGDSRPCPLSCAHVGQAADVHTVIKWLELWRWLQHW